MKVEKYFNHVKKDNYIFLKRFLISILKIYDFHQYIQQKKDTAAKNQKIKRFFFISMQQLGLKVTPMLFFVYVFH